MPELDYYITGKKAPSETVRCPHCHGRTELSTLRCGCNDKRCVVRRLPCRTCDATGRIAPEQLRNIDYGRQMADERLIRRATNREESLRLNVDFAEWSRIEWYGRPETEAGQRAWNQRLQELGLAEG